MIPYYWNLLRKNKLLIVAAPLLMMLLVLIYLQFQDPLYRSQALINTGFTSGVSLESVGGRGADYLAASNAFDNLISMIEARKTREEIAIRLLVSHLQLDQENPLIITPAHRQRLQKTVPEEVKKLVSADTEKSVAGLLAFMVTSRDNYLLKLLNRTHPHYSLYVLERINARRMASSDLLELSYESNDPGISRQTLVILLEVLTRNFKASKASYSSDVVAYFEEQLRRSTERLRDAEERYAAFNKTHRIINYYEETKSIANHKDDFNVMFHDERAKFAGAEASLQHLENVLPKSDLLYLQSEEIIARRNELAQISGELAVAQQSDSLTAPSPRIEGLRRRAEQIKDELRQELNKLHMSGRTLDQLPLNQVLDRWLENAIIIDESRARLKVLQQRKEEFDRYYDAFSPLGSMIKRFEREIGVLEEEYLELLHSLTLAKLKQENIQISNQLRVLDDPSYPLEAAGRHLKRLLAMALLGGLLLAGAVIYLLDYFSPAIKSAARARRLTGLEVAAVIPAVSSLASEEQHLYQQCVEFLSRQLEWKRRQAANGKTGPFALLLFDSHRSEDNSTLVRQLVRQLRSAGRTVIVQKDESIWTELLRSKQAAAHLAAAEEASQFAAVWPVTGGYQASMTAEFDYLIVEIPPITRGIQGRESLAGFDHALLTCHADQRWSQADEVALANIRAVLPCPTELLLFADPWECRLWLGN